MNQWREKFTPHLAAVFWSRSQSCSGGFDLRKYTAPNGNTGFGKGFSCASTPGASVKAADNIPAQANCIRLMTAGNPPNPVAKNCTSGRAGNRNIIDPSLMVPRSASRSVLLIPFFTRGPGERRSCRESLPISGLNAGTTKWDGKGHAWGARELGTILPMPRAVRPANEPRSQQGPLNPISRPRPLPPGYNQVRNAEANMRQLLMTILCAAALYSQPAGNAPFGGLTGGRAAGRSEEDTAAR